ncbi:MarR family winged helix-turn-helix transcriptional regulator [Maribacter halichondriae]|uniref:MarR family winged helix-turn-helix transcriptional regulator n=1 Tax=Maribacter halichondriae TaxID=2980554 RepID=UPI002359AF89|nr:MarR family transcriptional regulator [Maribacter sp. Hal144]
MKEVQPISRLENVLFYILEKSIKSYRQFAQRNLSDVNDEITIDQWLVLKTIHDCPNITQREIAEKIFKDHASITRMIDLLVKKGFLERSVNSEDRRRFGLELTPIGKIIQQESIPVIMQNRKKALEGLSQEEIETLKNLLQKITINCTNNLHQKTK